ncbi:MAG: hypothetical protein WCF82_12605 [Microcoleus sp.]
MSKKIKVLWGGRPASPEYTIKMRDSLPGQESGNADSYLLPRIFLRTREAERLDIGSQALAWEPVEKNILLLVFPKTFTATG